MQAGFQLRLIAGVLLCALWAPNPAGAQASAQPAVVFDRYMTPAAGADTLLAVQHALAAVEDRWLPVAWGDERRRSALALGLAYRSAKLLLVDVPQDHFLMVAAHEVFGHGARFRELGDGRIRYGFDAPIPYGDGEAVTKFSGRFPVSPLADLNVAAAGIEAQHAVSNAIFDRAAGRGRVHYREAWLYFESRLAAMGYVLSASPHSSEGHDVADFLETFERACASPCQPITRRQLQRRVLATLADPMLYYAVHAFAADYVGRGRTSGAVPLLPVGGGFGVLPSAGYALAPYGADWTVRAVVSRTARPASPRAHTVLLRVGTTGASTPWAFGVRVAGAARLRGLTFDLAADVWRQPELLADAPSDPLKTGASLGATTVLRFPHSWRPLWFEGVLVTGGYKTRGYVPGEQLSGGGFLRAGLVLGR